MPKYLTYLHYAAWAVTLYDFSIASYSWYSGHYWRAGLLFICACFCLAIALWQRQMLRKSNVNKWKDIVKKYGQDDFDHVVDNRLKILFPNSEQGDKACSGIHGVYRFDGYYWRKMK